MLNLTQVGAVSFTKGCYLGQEIVARAEHRGQVKRQLFRTKRPIEHVFVGASVDIAERGKVHGSRCRQRSYTASWQTIEIHLACTNLELEWTNRFKERI